MSPVRAAFVMEQTLGHVTHARNLRAVVDQQDDVAATWLPIAYDVDGPARLVPLLRSNWSVRASWRARRALDAALAERAHDALFFHTQVTALFAHALMLRYPTVVSLDATPINYDAVGASYRHRPAGDGFVDRQKYLMNRRALHAAARLVAWSRWAHNSLVADYGIEPERVTVLAPGAAPAYFAVGERRSAGPPPATSAPVRVLFVGGDFERKGGHFLLEALRGDLAARCELHVVTKQPVAAGPNVTTHTGLGPNSPELQRLFQAADIFVLPSLGECLAVVLMEATAAGLPIITTDVGALSEAVLPGESGLVVPPGDARALRLALQTLVDQPQRRQRMGRAGYVLAREKFDAQRNNHRLLELIAEVGRPHVVSGRTA